MNKALLIVLACVIGGGIAFSRISFDRMLQVGTISAPLQGSASQTPQPTEEVFASARPIEWSGRIVRVFASGQALEVATHESPLGFAYLQGNEGNVFSLTEGAVTVEGLWTGTSCQYGRCASHIEVTDLRPAQVELY